MSQILNLKNYFFSAQAEHVGVNIIMNNTLKQGHQH